MLPRWKRWYDNVSNVSRLGKWFSQLGRATFFVPRFCARVSVEGHLHRDLLGRQLKPYVALCVNFNEFR